MHTFIKVFQMPVFMLASGFLYSKYGSWKTFMKKKINRLLIPYILFSVLQIVLRSTLVITRGESLNIEQYIYELATGGYYWFLYVLLIFVIVCKLINRNWILNLIMVTSFILPYVFTETPFIINRLIVYPFYFIVGINLRKVYNTTTGLINRAPMIFALSTTCLFILSVLFPSHLFYLHASEIIGCIMVWTWSILLIQSKYIKTILSHFGRYSLQYYVNHLCISLAFMYPILNEYFNRPVLVLCLAFTLRTFMSWVILQFEKKIKCLRPYCGL